VTGKRRRAEKKVVKIFSLRLNNHQLEPQNVVVNFKPRGLQRAGPEVTHFSLDR
jgi:hypothetical protein